jgi:transcriptional regulator with XRE-family HTH domain
MRDLQTQLAIAQEIAGNYAQPVDASAVGRNLKRIRKAKGEKQDAIAARMGVKQTRLSIWEGGRYKSFDMRTLIKLAQGYGSTVDDLLVGVDAAYDSHRAQKTEVLDKTDSPSPESAHSETAPPVLFTYNEAVRNPQAHPPGDLAHGADPEGTTTRRREDSEHAIDTEVRHGIMAERQAAIEDYARRLYASADSVRAVADALRSGAQPPAPGGTGPVPRSGRPSLHPKSPRRRGA